MVGAGEVDDVSMESVADASGVSRALVYKHFANRQELLSALYERESAQLHAQLTAAVQKAEGLAGKLRSLITGALEAQASKGTTFAALGQSGSRTRAHRDRQRRRDGRTQRYFTQVAVQEFDVEPAVAATTLAFALSTIPSVLRQWRQRPTEKHAALLADCYVAMVVGGLEGLAGHRGD
jgi:AcrR family transcriptional regulator